MAGWTNKGKYIVMGCFFRASTLPARFYVALCSTTAGKLPTADSNTLSDLQEISTGNGYWYGGSTVTRDKTGWDTLTEDDTNDRAYVRIKDLTWTASGGNIPKSLVGSGARYAVLLDDNATVAKRRVLAWWDLGSLRTLTSGNSMTLQDLELRFN